MMVFKVFQPTVDMLELKKDKDTNYVVNWKSKRVFTCKLKPIYTAFVQSIKLLDVNCKKKLIMIF